MGSIVGRSITFVSAWILVLVAVTTPGEAAGEGVAFTYLGNEGFMITAGGSTILIDALQGPGLEGYVTLPDEPRARMETAQPPFDGVDLILASHRHQDHFDTGSVGSYLTHDTDALFVSTSEAVERLRRVAPDLPKIDTRLLGLDPGDGEVLEIEPAGIPLELMFLHHGSGRSLINLGIIVTLGDMRILHMGDTSASAEELAVFELGKREIDIAMVPYWYLLDADGRTAIAEQVAPHRVVAIHIPAADAPSDYFGKAGDLPGLLRRLREDWPGLIVFAEPMEQQRL